MRFRSARLHTGMMLAFILVASWTVAFNVGVSADTAADAQAPPEAFTITKAEFVEDDKDTPECELSALPDGWCDRIEEGPPQLWEETAFERWVQGIAIEFAYQMTASALALAKVLVNSIAPAAYTIKTVAGEQVATLIGQAGSYGGMLGITAYVVWHVKRSFSEVAQ